MSLAYEINSASVSGEIIDGEAIVLHLRRGHYFSMEGGAALIWGGMERCVPVAEIADALAERFDIDPIQARADTDALVEQLVENDLIIATERADGSAAGLGALVPDGTSYSTPQIEMFTDMQDLLLLDPIHEVDDAGWPLAPDQARA